MSKAFKTGLDLLLNEKKWQDQVQGQVAYLGHEASVTEQLLPGILGIHKIFGSRLIKAFGPQHGFTTLDQDNMIETAHQMHPSLGIPVYSLYSETRTLTHEMAEGIDTLIIDLQDVGTRVYTYIWTLYQVMDYCAASSIKIMVLDRPNPLGGLHIEGNLPDAAWYSFVCRASIPMKHGMTIGELALYFNDILEQPVNLVVVPMTNWKRSMTWESTQRAWINPSPNLPRFSSTVVYPGTVLFEGTTLSEGRGTTRILELFGHPKLNPYHLADDLDAWLSKKGQLSGYYLRPTFFKPTFQKFQHVVCGGFQLHCTDTSTFEAWKTMQFCMQFLFHHLEIDPFWNQDAYEYETLGLAIDYINGQPDIREWIEKNGSADELLGMELSGREEFLEKRMSYLLYD